MNGKMDCCPKGALWNRAKAALDEPRRRELHAPFPMLAMKPQRVAPPPSAGVYVCPVYKTLARAGDLSSTGHSTNFVVSVKLPSTDDCTGVLLDPLLPTFSPHWIKRGVALFLALSY